VNTSLSGQNYSRKTILIYTIGFNIIESFKNNNPKIDDRELMDLTPEHILLLSKYDE